MEKEQKIFCDFYRSIGSSNTQYLMVVSSYCFQGMEESRSENQGRGSSREQILRLEIFLNHCMRGGADHQLEFANLTQVQGYCALDFSILAPRSRIKGRAIITKDSFYVLAMQCHPKHYVEDHFSHFIKSFQILHVSPDS